MTEEELFEMLKKRLTAYVYDGYDEKIVVFVWKNSDTGDSQEIFTLYL